MEREPLSARPRPLRLAVNKNPHDMELLTARPQNVQQFPPPRPPPNIRPPDFTENLIGLSYTLNLTITTT